MTRRKKTVVAVAVVLAVVVEIVLAGLIGGVPALAYALALGALLLLLLQRGLRSLLPPAVRFERLLARPGRQPEMVEQLRTVERDLRLSMFNDRDLYRVLRPRVREIASVRLARHHGIDLDREPERAEALIGAGRVWELVRPDREAPLDRLSRGWPRSQMEQLIDELERL